MFHSMAFMHCALLANSRLFLYFCGISFFFDACISYISNFYQLDWRTYCPFFCELTDHKALPWKGIWNRVIFQVICFILHIHYSGFHNSNHLGGLPINISNLQLLEEIPNTTPICMSKPQEFDFIEVLNINKTNFGRYQTSFWKRKEITATKPFLTQIELEKEN